MIAALAAAALLAWLWLALMQGGFWRADQRLPVLGAAPDGGWPSVGIVIPARNEATTIAAVVAAHAASDYPGPVRLVVVDDGSDDGTGARAAAAGRGARFPVEVIAAPPLPPGWSGKLWAVNAGLAHLAETAPEARHILLTDADILHAPDTLRRLAAKAAAEDLALVSLMARLDARGIWGGLLIPAFIFFFQKLYPFPLVNDPRSPVAGAAGGCVLLRADALAAISGIAAIKGALIDDCALAAAVKTRAPRRRIWLGLADREVVSLRDNRSLGSVWSMVARTAFTQLGHSLWRLIGAVLGMGLVYLMPPIALVAGLAAGDGAAAALGAAAMALMAALYRPTLRLYHQPWLAGFALPVAAALYTAMTLSSAIRHWRGAGGRWKGRVYP